MTDHPALCTGPVGSPKRYRVPVDEVSAAVAGGEGLVYRAYDVERDVAVALKLVTVVNVQDYPRLVERSSVFSTIRHPNLMSHVEVFIGTALSQDSQPTIEDFDVIYSVAEWVDGEPMSAVVDTANTESLLGFVAGIARGLHCLHTYRSPQAPLGIVHRDVKPSNVRITPDCEAVLIDFGVARALDTGDLTQGVGTYRWRAPEVLSGSAETSCAVDTWGLGAIAYWVMTGQPPGLDGAAAAREQLLHTPRCEELADPVGLAAHIAALLETSPTKRPPDLERWATQLEAILRERRHAIWKRPTALTAVALIAIPGVAMAVHEVGGGADGVASTTISPPTTAVLAPESSKVEIEPKLVTTVGDVWHVACLGNIDSTIVTGAEPGQRIRATVAYAPDAFGVTGQPTSYVTGLTSNVGEAVPAFDSVYLGPLELTADNAGSFVIEWHCDRSQVGIPHLLTLGAGKRTIQVRVESRDELTGLEIEIDTDARDDEPVELLVGSDHALDVLPELTAEGQAMVAAHGLKYTGRNFDDRMIVTSSDPSIARVSEADRGIWQISALKTGTVVIEARIPGTERVTTASIAVEVL